MNNSVAKILIRNLNEKNFIGYNEVLKKEIISIFVRKIQEKDSFFLYSNLVELLENVEKYLDEEENFIFENFYDLCKSNEDPKEISRYLTDVYEKIIK